MGPGSRAAVGVAAGSGATIECGHPSRCGVASRSSPAWGSWGCITRVKAGAGSASWAGASERRTDHPSACISMCPSKTEHSCSPGSTTGRPPSQQSSRWVSEASLCSWTASGVIPVCLTLTPLYKLTCISTPYSTSTAPTFSTLGCAFLGTRS